MVDDVAAVSDTDETTTQVSLPSEREIRSADSTLKEISADNATIRESLQVHEKFLNIEVQDMLCQMRADTVLVLVDIPGINEAGSGNKYKNYVTEKWNTFDCVVLVMDGTKGVNDKEQVKFFEFAKDNLDTKKDLPLIILCNKIDDPKEEEQSLLVDEARKEVKRVFDVPDCKKALDDIIRHAEKGSRAPASTFPVFIAMSAVHAFIYRTASLMSMSQFKKFDAALIEKLGHEEVGKWKWRKLGEK